LAEKKTYFHSGISLIGWVTKGTPFNLLLGGWDQEGGQFFLPFPKKFGKKQLYQLERKKGAIEALGQL